LTIVGAVFALNVRHASDRTAAAYRRFYAGHAKWLRPVGYSHDRVGYWRISGAFMLFTGIGLLVLISWTALSAQNELSQLCPKRDRPATHRRHGSHVHGDDRGTCSANY
jgi:hypothetical protein